MVSTRLMRQIKIWLGRMDDDLIAIYSDPRPTHFIHWRLVTEDWIPAYCKKARINSDASPLRNHVFFKLKGFVIEKKKQIFHNKKSLCGYLSCP